MRKPGLSASLMCLSKRPRPRWAPKSMATQRDKEKSQATMIMASSHETLRTMPTREIMRAVTKRVERHRVTVVTAKTAGPRSGGSSSLKTAAMVGGG